MIRRITDENASLVDHARSEGSAPARMLRRRDLISGCAASRSRASSSQSPGRLP
jgi:hypothetical protein